MLPAIDTKEDEAAGDEPEADRFKVLLHGFHVRERGALVAFLLAKATETPGEGFVGGRVMQAESLAITWPILELSQLSMTRMEPTQTLQRLQSTLRVKPPASAGGVKWEVASPESNRPEA